MVNFVLYFYILLGTLIRPRGNLMKESFPCYFFNIREVAFVTPFNIRYVSENPLESVQLFRKLPARNRLTNILKIVLSFQVTYVISYA